MFGRKWHAGRESHDKITMGSERERERESERDRQTDRQSDSDRHRQTETDRHRHGDTQKRIGTQKYRRNINYTERDKNGWAGKPHSQQECRDPKKDKEPEKLWENNSGPGQY